MKQNTLKVFYNIVAIFMILLSCTACFMQKSERISRGERISANTIVSTGGWVWQNPIPQGNRFNGIWGSSPSDIFAVGDAGTIMHYNGKEWSLMRQSTDEYLLSVFGSSSSCVFACGIKKSLTSENPYDSCDGVVLRYDGKSWKQISFENKWRPESIWCSSL